MKTLLPGLSTALLLLTIQASWAAQTYTVERLNNGEPIISARTFLDAGIPEDGDNINGPSLIKVPDWIAPEDRAEPQANYYLYFANHRGNYIRMAWAENLAGPYTLFNATPGSARQDRGVLALLDAGDKRVLDHGVHIWQEVASPRVFVDDQNQRIVMLFHTFSGVEREDGSLGAKGQKTHAATSQNGLDFNQDIQPARLGAFYFDVFTYAGRAYAFANQGYFFAAPEGATLENGCWWTPPVGFNYKNELWTRRGGPVREDHEADPEEDQDNPRHFGNRVVGNQLHLFFTRRDDGPESILLTKIDLDTGVWTQWNSSYPPEHILSPERGWEGADYPPEPSTGGGATGVNQLRDPFIYEEDGRVFLFYCGAGEEAIGLAELISNPTISSIHGHLWYDAEHTPWLVADVIRRSGSPKPWIPETKTDLKASDWTPRPIDGIQSIEEILHPDVAGDNLWELVRFRSRLPSPFPDQLFLRLKYPS
jgi:hypothetical protein